MSGEAIIFNLSHYHLSHIIFSNLYISSNYSEWPGTQNMAINFKRYFTFSHFTVFIHQKKEFHPGDKKTNRGWIKGACIAQMPLVKKNLDKKSRLAAMINNCTLILFRTAVAIANRQIGNG